MKRDDWLVDLSAYIKERRDMPFAWGSNDCMLFAADGYQVMHGVDLAEPYRGYTDERTALRVLRKHGGHAAIVDKHLQRREPVDLQTGDIGLITLDDREFLALIYNQWAITPGPQRAVMNLAMNCSIGWAT